MAAGVSTYYQNLIMNHLFDNGASGYQALLWVALCETQPVIGDSDITAREADYSGYARTSISAATGFTIATVGESVSAVAITFPVSGDTTTTVYSFWAICDAITTGNMLVFGDITSPTAVDDTEVPIISAGAMTITLS